MALIHAGFWKDPCVVRLSPTARCLLISLLDHADCKGRLRVAAVGEFVTAPGKRTIFFEDPHADAEWERQAQGWLEELIGFGEAVEYIVNGVRYCVVPRVIMQRVNKGRQNDSQLPDPPPGAFDHLLLSVPVANELLDHTTWHKKRTAATAVREGKADDAKWLFDEWVRLCKKSPTRTKFTDRRKRALIKAMRSYSKEELHLAIQGCSRDPWRMGKNEHNKPFNDLVDYILKDSNTEGMIAAAQDGGARVSGQGSVFDSALRQEARRGGG